MKLPSHVSLMIYNTLLISTLMAISSTNLLMIWMSMELNLFSFVPVMLNKAAITETSSSIMYFLAQALGSSIMLMSMIMLLSSHWLMLLSKHMLMFSMLLKAGAAPCHYWYPMTMETTKWLNCILLSTWQKIIPLFIIVYIMKSEMMAIVASMNALIGGIMGLSQSSLKKMMSYSSITHMGWMLSSSTMNMPHMAIMYFTMYSMMIVPLFIMFNKMSKNKVQDLWSTQMMLTWTLPFSIMLLSLGGLPPLTGFMPKLMMMNSLMTFSNNMTMVLIVGSLMNLFFYLNVVLNMLMKTQEHTNKQKQMNFHCFMSLSAALNLSMIIIMIL